MRIGGLRDEIRNHYYHHTAVNRNVVYSEEYTYSDLFVLGTGNSSVSKACTLIYICVKNYFSFNTFILRIALWKTWPPIKKAFRCCVTGASVIIQTMERPVM